MTPLVDTGLPAALAGLRDAYAAKRPGSRELHRRAQVSMPGGNTRTQVDFLPFPVYTDRAAGCRLWDVDGLSYLDVLNNYTSLVHGHPDEELRRAIAKQAERGTAYGTPSLLEIELAEAIRARVPSMEHVAFTNSGTEAALYTIRVARAFTGRDQIVKVEGGYHGGLDSVQVSVRSMRSGQPVPEPGVAGATADSTLVVPFNDPEAALRTIRRSGRGIAAVIVEPLLGAGGCLPAEQAFLQALRGAADETGALLVFDEIQTLRLAYGGLQEVYEVKPDLTLLGKLIGGGFPVGAFGGRRDVMEVLDPRRVTPVPHSGTFNANPMTAAAGLESLRRLTREAVERLNAAGDDLRGAISKGIERHGVPLSVTGYGSLMQVHAGLPAPRSFSDVLDRPSLPVHCLFLLLLDQGVMPSTRCSLNLSTALTPDDHADLTARFDAALERLAQLS